LAEPAEAPPTFIDLNTDSQSIVVNAPVSEVYHRCLRFEDFPAFINSISKMDRIDNTHFSCTWAINGEEVQSDVQIIMRVPDRRIAWQAASDHFRVGVMFFVPIGSAATKLTIKVRSIVEPVQLTGALRHYLRNFKVYIENDTEGKSAFARPRSSS
jgi:Polyketide cyclase / dehydrase and lipid transport.